MFCLDHNPPHFHATYSGREALIDITKLEVIRGDLPRGALLLALAWARDHQDERLEDWTLRTEMQSPKKIAPLS